MSIQTRRLEYVHADTTFEGVLAWDSAVTEPRPGVAVAHTWAGRGEFEEQKARELAEQGYVGFALDVYGRGVRGTSVEENQALIRPLLADRPLLQARLGAAIEAMSGQGEVDASRLAAIGYCFGGLCVLDLARMRAPVRAVISVHGLFTPPEQSPSGSIDASVLCLHGYDDPMVPPDSVLALASEMSAAGADWQLHAYGNTLHAFTNPAADKPDMGTLYNAVADRRASQAIDNFLREQLG